MKNFTILSLIVFIAFTFFSNSLISQSLKQKQTYPDHFLPNKFQGMEFQNELNYPYGDEFHGTMYLKKGSNEQIYLLDTVFVYEIDVTYRYTYTHDSNGNRLTLLYEIWENGNWINYLRNTFTYDINGNALTRLNEIWGNGNWVNVWRDTFTYNANGNILTLLTEEWESGNWVNVRIHTYTYDANGNKLTNLTEEWENGSWVNVCIYTYTYDANGNRLTLLCEIWENGSWMNEWRITYTYDINGNLLTELYEDWENGNWMNDRIYTYTYDINGNLLTKLYEYWENGNWMNYRIYTYTYDANGNAVSGDCFQWDGQNWVQDMLGVIGIYYNNRNDHEFFIACHVEASYISITVTGIEERPDENITEFYCKPNPSYRQTTINLRLANEIDGEIGLFSINGNNLIKIYKGIIQQGENSFILNTEQLTPGMYFIKLSSISYSKSIKILITR